MFVTFISICFFIICDAALLKDERTNLISQKEDILSHLSISSSGYVDRKLSSDFQWTKDSLHKRRTSFTKEEIDKSFIDDLNVEFLLDGMNVGHNGRCYKPIGLRSDQTPQAVVNRALLSQDNRETNSGSLHRQKRTFIPRYEKFEAYWINATIPYYFDDTTFQNPTEALTLIREVMDYIEDLTCVNFIEKSLMETNEMINQGNYDFIKFIGSGFQGCGTYLGRFSSYYEYTQTIHIIVLFEGVGCVNRGTIGHELAHVLGMHHEFTRSDRDEHVTVIFDNILRDKFLQFEKETTINRTPYDYGSLLQYPSNGNAINYQEDTLVNRDPDLSYLLRSSSELSYYDIMAINKAYKCSDNCSTKKCEYGAVKDETCTCICPAGLQGASCEDVVNADICGGIINIIPGKETVLKSPAFKKLPPEGAICHWLLKAPKDYSVTIEVDDFSMSWNPDTNRCYHWLEINYNLIGQRAPKHCGDSFPRRKMSTSKYGETNLMMLKWDTKTVSGGRREGGFKLRANTYRVYGTKSKGCPKPPKIENAVYNYNTVGRKNGAIITYTCQYPYTMFGDTASITCQADNTWSNPAFTCELKEPDFACDFEKEDCDFRQDKSTPYQWKRTTVDGNSFFRIDAASNTMGVRDQSLFINAALKKYKTYCLSVSLRRPSGNTECASYTIYYVTSTEKNTLMYSINCYDIEWTTYRTTFSATAPPSIHIKTVARPNSLFNLDLDDIIIREGGC